MIFTESPAISKMRANRVPNIKTKLEIKKKKANVVLWPLRGWAQEDVEEHSEQHKNDICHDAKPKTRIFKQLRVVGTEEDVTNGHSS